MNSLQQFGHKLTKYIAIGVNKDQTSVVKRAVLINIFSILGTIVLVLFGSVNIETDNYLTGIIEIILGVALIINLLLTPLTRNINLAATIVLLILSAALMFLLYQGGIDNTGIFWFFTFPPAAFFLKTKNEGFLWTTGLLIAITIAMSLTSLGIIHLPFSFITMRQLIASLMVVTLLIYFYEDLQEKPMSPSSTPEQKSGNNFPPTSQIH